MHLAALGRFYANPKLNIAPENDWRYMPNIVSSAITNKPPPAAVANLLAKRNKIHHLDSETDETLLNLFDRDPGAADPGVKPKTANTNHATMPSRNYCILGASHSHTSGGQTNGINGSNSANGTNGHATNGDRAYVHAAVAFTSPKNPRFPLHNGEQNAGTAHPAADGITRTGLAGVDGLDVTIRVEINPSDREGHTQGYGFSIPALESGAYKERGEKW